MFVNASLRRSRSQLTYHDVLRFFYQRFVQRLVGHFDDGLVIQTFRGRLALVDRVKELRPQDGGLGGELARRFVVFHVNVDAVVGQGVLQRGRFAYGGFRAARSEAAAATDARFLRLVGSHEADVVVESDTF